MPRKSKTTTLVPTATTVNPAVVQSAMMPDVTNLIAIVTRNRVGAPTIRTRELDEEICSRIACGESLVAVCQDPLMPSYPTVQRWRATDHAFADMLERAYEMHALTLDDIAEDILSGGPTSTGDFRRDEARVAHMRWRLGKLNRKRFGDKMQVDVTAVQVFVMPDDAIDGEGY